MPVIPIQSSPTSRGLSVNFNPLPMTGYETGALAIVTSERAIISVPSQLGCTVGCTFCLSKDTPLIRNLSAEEMLSLAKAACDSVDSPTVPFEMSFTGEGEPALNWRETARACERLHQVSARFDRVRYCFSGVGANKLLPKLSGGGLPVRLQCSLHAARQSVRDRLIPRSIPLPELELALRVSAHNFVAIELNVVLQEGVNDSEEDLLALARFGDPAWPILLNPKLTPGGAVESPTSGWFERELTRLGREVKRYRKVAQKVSEVCTRLTAAPIGQSPQAKRA